MAVLCVGIFYIGSGRGFDIDDVIVGIINFDIISLRRPNGDRIVWRCFSITDIDIFDRYFRYI